MTTYRIDLTWDGSQYCGWQRQPNAPSIQEAVEQALQIIFPSENIVVQAAGRTDAGVHALHQVAGFSIQGFREPQQVLKGLNSKLPSDIVCIHVSVVAPDFNPRHQSKEKLYRYRLLTQKNPCPFRHRYTWHLPYELDIQAMQNAALLFCGTHDFAAFRAQGCSASSTIRTITRSEIVQSEGELHFEVQGKGFLRHMVRIMMGSLVAVGQTKLTVEQLQKTLHTSDRSSLGQTAPAHGLWLVWTTLLDNTDEIQ